MSLNNQNIEKAEENNNALCSFDDIEEVEVDQLGMEALIDAGITIKNEDYMEEITVIENVQITREECVEKCVCRTCLGLTNKNKCCKLFDRTKRQFCLEVRKKLDNIVGKLNYKVSVDPVVCERCLELIHSTFEFKKRLEAVEKRLKQKLDGNVERSTVDLRSLLDSCGNAEDNDCRSTNERGGITSSVSNQSTMPFVKSQDVGSDNFDILGEHHASRLTRKFQNIEEYLMKRKELLSSEGTIKISSPTLPNTHTRCTQSTVKEYSSTDGNDCDNKLESVDEGSLPDLEVVNGKRVEIVDEVAQRRNPNDANVFFGTWLKRQKQIIDTNRLSKKFGTVKKEKRALEAVSVVLEDAEMCVDVVGESKMNGMRLEQGETVDDIEKDSRINNDEGTACGQDGKTEFASSDETDNRSKPRAYPRSFDLFDEEHDRYFEKYKQRPECKLALKWSRFARRPPQFGTGPFLCPECGVVIRSKPLYRKHLDEHKGEHLVVCPHCGRLVKNQRLKYHISTKHRPPAHECETCDKKFHVPHLLATHVNTMHTNENEMHQCQVCGKLLRGNSIRDHMRTHNPTKIYACDVCGKTFQARSYWVRHKKRHASTNEISCSYCGKYFKCKDYLMQHVKQVHEQTDYNCTTCGKRLSNRDALRRHIIHVHAPNKMDKRRKHKPPDIGGDEYEGGTCSRINQVEVNKVRIIRQDENLIVYEQSQ